MQTLQTARYGRFPKYYSIIFTIIILYIYLSLLSLLLYMIMYMYTYIYIYIYIRAVTAARESSERVLVDELDELN